MMGGRGGAGMLLMNEQVREELKLTEEQSEKLREEFRGGMEGMRELFEKMRDMDEEERQKELQKLRDKRQKQEKEILEKILSGEQLERLEEIRIQTMGFSALGDPKVIEALDITQEQGSKLTKIRDEMREKSQALREDFDFQNTPREEMRELFQKMREKGQKIRKDAMDKALNEVLTAQQREKFEDLKGEEIELQMGFGRGGFGQRGMRPGGRRPGGGDRPQRPGGQDRPRRPRSSNAL
jgi:hypothetical protein